MPRGYSASRTGSKRATVRVKRERSQSVQAMVNTTRGETAAAGVTVTAVTATASKAPVLRSKSKGSSSVAADVMKARRDKHVTAPTPGSTAADRSESRRAASTAAGKSPKPQGKRSGSMLRHRLAALEEELDSDFEESEDERETVAKPDVMAKYKEVGRVVDEVIALLAAACVPGADTKTLCDLGDAEMNSRMKNLYSKAKDDNGRRIQKGICYPTNISVGEVLCNHSPFRADEATRLRPLHTVKIHCGCHLDGYPVVAARTIVVPTNNNTSSSSAANTDEAPLSRSASNAIEAARVALTGMIHMMRPGTANADVTDFISAVGHTYGAEAIEGVLSNRIKRWVLDGVDCIIGRRVIDTVPQQDVAECEVAPFQVWALDIAFTNVLGHDEIDDSGNTNEEEEASRKLLLSESAANADDKKCFRTTPTEEAACIFRRTPMDFPNDARVQQANEVLKELTTKFGCFPFHFKALASPLRGKMGINVLLKHQVVDRLSPMRVKNALSGRRITARFSATVAVTGKRITVLCGAPPEVAVENVPAAVAPHPVVGDKASLAPELAEVLSRSLDFATAAALRAEKEGQPKAKRARKE